MKKSAPGTDWKKWRAVTGIYLFMNLGFIVQRIIFDLQQDQPQEILNSVIDISVFAGIWIAFTIPVLRLTSGRTLNFPGFFTLFIAGVLFALAHAALYLLFVMSIPGLMTAGQISSVNEYLATFLGLGHAWRLLSFGFIVVVSYAYDYYFLSKERERRAAQLQVQLTESKLDALKMQLHPHFLFNTLNAISTLVDENPAAAKDTLARLSDLLRLALENVQTQKVPLTREIEFIDLYLLIQRTRHGDRLVVRKKIDGETMDAAVPYLILQPIIENAIKHGIDVQPGPGTITIASSRWNGKLTLTVEDSGPGRKKAMDVRKGHGLGMGLANTQARLNQLYGDAHTFLIEDLPGGDGTRVSLVIPYHEEATLREEGGRAGG
jgi:sensor histidine kinase YesM